MLCERMERGGAETHILTLADGLMKRGHAVSVASSGGVLADELEKRGVRHLRLPLDSHKVWNMLYCRRRLRHLLKSGKFDIVHSHSRLASLLCADIAKKSKVAFFSTVHAKFKVSPLTRRLSRWGDFPIAVSEDLRQYLYESYSVQPRLVEVIPNGVDTARFCPYGTRSRGRTVVFLSRLDGDCSLGARLLCEIAPRLYEKYSDLKIKIGGGGSALSDLQDLARRVNQSLSASVVECVGEVCDSAELLRGGDLFVGVSRAAIEAGLCGLPIILCGDEGYFGRLTEENFEGAFATNFSARGRAAAGADTLFEDICDAFSMYDRQSEQKIRELLLKNCSADSCVALTERHYLRNVRQPRQSGSSLLCGYYGYSNMGDDALLLASIERARREFEGEELCALTKNGRQDSRSFGVECIKRYSPLKVVRAIRKSDRFILGGGTLFQSETSRRSLFYYSSLVLLARLMRKEVIAWGSGIGRVSGRLDRALLRCAVSSCSSFEARDMRSLAIARHIISSRASEGCDLCESRERFLADERRASFLLERIFGGKPPRFVAISLKGNADTELRMRIARELLMKKEQGATLVFFVLCPHEDGKISREMAELVGGRVVEKLCFDDLCLMLRYAEELLSMRLHALIAARVAGCRAFALGNDEKILGYCRERTQNEGK